MLYLPKMEVNMEAINLKLKELFKDTSFESYQYEDFETSEELIEALREQITEDEVIHYSNAIKYLSENDAGLQDSLSLAHELGYTVDNINSELLATLLQQQNYNEELSKLEGDIEEIYSEKES